MMKKFSAGTSEITKILILAANPRDMDQLRLDEEVREIDEGLRRSKHRDRFELVQRRAVRIQDLRRALLDEKPQIVHFCGHGVSENKLIGEKNTRDLLYHKKDTSNKGIVLEDEKGNSVVVSKEALKNLFEILAEGVKCILLNACYTEEQANAISEYIPYVIGMRQSIGDKASIEFSTGFYDGLGAGMSVEASYQLGCSAIELKDLPEHLTPVLKRKPGAPKYFFFPSDIHSQSTGNQESVVEETEAIQTALYSAEMGTVWAACWALDGIVGYLNNANVFLFAFLIGILTALIIKKNESAMDNEGFIVITLGWFLVFIFAAIIPEALKNFEITSKFFQWAILGAATGAGGGTVTAFVIKRIRYGIKTKYVIMVGIAWMIGGIVGGSFSIAIQDLLGTASSELIWNVIARASMGAIMGALGGAAISWQSGLYCHNSSVA